MCRSVQPGRDGIRLTQSSDNRIRAEVFVFSLALLRSICAEGQSALALVGQGRRKNGDQKKSTLILSGIGMTNRVLLEIASDSNIERLRCRNQIHFMLETQLIAVTSVASISNYGTALTA